MFFEKEIWLKRGGCGRDLVTDLYLKKRENWPLLRPLKVSSSTPRPTPTFEDSLPLGTTATCHNFAIDTVRKEKHSKWQLCRRINKTIFNSNHTGTYKYVNQFFTIYTRMLYINLRSCQVNSSSGSCYMGTGNQLGFWDQGSGFHMINGIRDQHILADQGSGFYSII